MSKVLLGFVLLFSFAGHSAEKVSAYLTSGYMAKEEVSKKLTEAGFQILGEHAVNGNTNHTVILFTETSLKDKAAKESRGFASVMRALVNSDKKELRFTNPNYFLRAFLQKDFDEALAQGITQKLEKSFGAFKGTKDLLKDSDLSGYHFMMGMPYYEDMLKVGKGSAADIAQKLKAKNKLIFEMDLGPNSKVMGVTLSKNVESFVDKLKVPENSVLLPYLVLVENGKAKILHAKYYLAVSLPTLSMGQFMTISDIPGKIEDEVEELVK